MTEPDDSQTTGLPQWARTIAVVGIPGVIAIFVVWIGARDIMRVVTAIESDSVRLTEIEHRLDKNDGDNDDMRRLLRRICTNTAKSEDEKNRCFEK